MCKLNDIIVQVLQMKRIKNLAKLFITMFKISLFTFGGGYAMISLLENEFVSKKKWLESDEFFDLIAIAESTPGPIAINCSTYIGYKIEGVLGSIIATLGMVIPSFVIIFVISLFFDKFLSITWVAAAFKGVQICVIFLILSAGIKMFKQVKKDTFNITVMSATFIAMLLITLFSVNFSSIFFLLIGGALGLTIYLIKYFKDKRDLKKSSLEENSLDDTNLEKNGLENSQINNASQISSSQEFPESTDINNTEEDKL